MVAPKQEDGTILKADTGPYPPIEPHTERRRLSNTELFKQRQINERLTDPDYLYPTQPTENPFKKVARRDAEELLRQMLTEAEKYSQTTGQTTAGDQQTLELYKAGLDQEFYTWGLKAVVEGGALAMALIPVLHNYGVTLQQFLQMHWSQAGPIVMEVLVNKMDGPGLGDVPIKGIHAGVVRKKLGQYQLIANADYRYLVTPGYEAERRRFMENLDEKIHEIEKAPQKQYPGAEAYREELLGQLRRIRYINQNHWDFWPEIVDIRELEFGNP